MEKKIKKRVRKILSLLVTFSLIVSILPLIIFSFPNQAEAYDTFYEDFNNTTYKDSANTTADWNTTSGELRLPSTPLGWTKANGTTLGYDNISSNSGTSNGAQIALDYDRRPNIVWSDNSTGNGDIFFSKWNGSQWTKADDTPGYDNVSNTSGLSTQPKIILDYDYPVIVWEDYTTGNGDIFFSKWSYYYGWTKADGATPGYDNVSNSSGTSNGAQIILGSSSRPNIVWQDSTTGNGDICFSQWNDITWTGLTTSGYDNLSNNSGLSAQPQIAYDYNDYRPNIVWEDDTTGNGDIFFSKWNGTTWTGLATSGYDNISSDSGTSNGAKITFGSSSRPNIVWQDTTTGNGDIFFSQWNGSQWTGADGSTPGYDNVSNNSGSSSQPQIVLGYSGPNIVWQDTTAGNGDIFFSQWDGTAWKKADGVTSGYDNVSNNSGSSSQPKLVLDYSYDRPNIVWQDTTAGNGDIFFSQWDGTAWKKADGVTSGYDNVSNNSGSSSQPQIVLDYSNNRPNIVWQDSGAGNGDIFFSKYSVSYQSPRQGQSTKINTTTENILRATLNPYDNLNGQTINYFLSANGGTNWEQVTPNAEHIFANQGNDLRWKAVLSTIDSSVTPVIYDLDINYSIYSYTFYEGFYTETYKDTSNTNADWDTTSGKLRLPSTPIGWTKANGTTLGYDNLSNNSGTSNYPQIVFGYYDSRPYIVWSDNSTGNGDIFFSKWNGSQWTKADGITAGYDNVSNNSGLSTQPKIVLAYDYPMIVWEDYTTGNGDILFSQWSYYGWTGVDGITPGYDNISNSSGTSNGAQIILDNSYYPNIVWEDSTTGNGDICFSQWNGTTWTGLATAGYDNLSNNSGLSERPQIAYDYYNYRPNIVWQDSTTGNGDILFSKWNGSQWTGADGSTPGYDNVSNNSGSSSQPQIILDYYGPNIVWQDSTTGNGDILFSKWNGSQWTGADGSTPGYDNVSSNSGSSSQPQIVLGYSGPNIVWSDNTTGNGDIFFSRWSYYDWTKADGTTPGYDNVSSNSGSSSQPKIVLDYSYDRPNIVWKDSTAGNGDIFFSQWNGTAWTKADGVTSGYDNMSNNSGSSSQPQIVLDYSNNRPNIVWQDSSTGNGDIFFSKYTKIYQSPRQGQSTKINTTTENIVRANLSPYEYPNGQTIKYYLSVNGGTNWEQVTPNANHTFTNNGIDLRWKAVLSTTDNTVTPEIESLTIEYSTQTLPSPTVSSITPNQGYNNQVVNITNLAGVNFVSGATVKLTKSGQTVINATDVNVVTSNKITCKFDLNGKAAGAWNVVVTNPDTKSGTLTDGFTILQYTPPPADSQKPTGSVSINDGALFAHSTQVSLSLQYADNVGVTSMIVSNHQNFSQASWETPKNTKAWTLSTGDEEKSVYVKYKDGAGNPSDACSASINLVTQKTISRLAGPTRYETAVEISKKGWTTSDKVVLARGDLFPDALAGAPLAAKYSAPILITSPGFLTSSTQAEITRLKAKEVFILGSSDAVSEKVVSDLKEKCSINGTKIHRYGGATRYETASLIAQQLSSPANKTAFIATGENYPDALASASIGAANGMPILLVRGDIGKIPDTIKDSLRELGITKTIITGGSDVVPSSIESWLKDNGYSPQRLGGATRYDTTKLIADEGIESYGMYANSIAIAVGENFPDALTLGPYAGAKKAPLLLVREFLPNATKNFVETNKADIYELIIAGGSDVVSDKVVEEIWGIIK